MLMMSSPPPTKQPRVRTAAEWEAFSPPARPGSVLLADDEHLVSLAMTAALASAGYVTVGPAVDGEQAVQLARQAMPDIAVMDIRMPKRGGISAAKELFRDLLIPVVIVSAYSDAEQVQAASEVGVFGYLVKPVTPDQLRAAIEVAWAAYVRFVNERKATEDLRKRLEDRRLIEQAKWLMVSKRGMTEPVAVQVLRQTARDTRRSMVEVAQQIITEIGENPPGA
jgi:response regulator NasT